MRYSKQREEIIKIVKSTDRHPTADWVYKKVQKRLPNISLGTVYRNLNKLVELGELSALRDETVIRYDGKTNKHHHLRCVQCNTVYNVEVPEDELKDLLNENNGFSVSDFRLEITGKCQSCFEEG